MICKKLNNKGRTFLPFLLVVILPLMALVWLGWRMTANEKKSITAQLNDLIRDRLQIVAGELSIQISSMENKLTDLIESQDIFSNDLARVHSRSNPLITQVFYLNSKGALIYPNLQMPDLSDREQRFIERTREIVDGKTLILAKDELPAQNLSLAGNFHWHSYYWSDGLHLMYYKQNEDKSIIGTEVSTIRLVSDLISSLPTTSNSPNDQQAQTQIIIDAKRVQTGQAMFIKNNLGAIVHQWGDLTVLQSANDSVEISAPTPFQTWKLAVAYSRDTFSNFGGASAFNFISAIFLICMAVLGLSIYVYREQKRELIEASKRVNFVNQVSHELKTPLTNIRMYADLLESRLQDEDEQAKSFLTIITSESQRLTRLIGNILSFASKEKNKLAIIMTRTNIPELLKDILEHFRPSLEKNSVVISLQASEDIDRMADPDVIRQIIGNLISNIEKYAANGKRLEIIYTPNEDFIKINVKDFGPGIPKREQAKIFAPFYRISSSITEGVSGTGIGLSISRDLARLHGGDLLLISSEFGAEFELRIQAKRA